METNVYTFWDELADEDNEIVFGGTSVPTTTGDLTDADWKYYDSLSGTSGADAYSGYSTNISDPKMLADLQATKAQATATGNKKLLNTVDLILKYGEKALAILVGAGVISGPALAKSGYSNVNQDATGKVLIGSSPTPTEVPGKGKIFGLDFSSPTVIIVTFIVVMLLAYFLFFDKKKK